MNSVKKLTLKDNEDEEWLDLLEFEERLDRGLINCSFQSGGERCLYKKRKNLGPGGLGCKCCRPYQTSKESAMHLNKTIRVETKEEIKYEVMDTFVE